MNATTYRWLAWEPGQVMANVPNPELTKLTKPNSVSFVSAALGHSPIIEAAGPGRAAAASGTSGLTAAQVLEEVRDAGGWFRVVDGGLSYDLGAARAGRLKPAIREREADLLMLLVKPEGACPGGHAGNYWQDAVGQWHCMECEPGPAQHRMRGVDLATLGSRAIVLPPPTSDLGAPGSWVRTPARETAEVVCYRADGGEVLVRTLKSDRLVWFDPAVLAGEETWGWGA
ncbi:MAG TPA: hypothetical protein VMV31_09905 [Terriglobales bacterium]|nr:hypothetical protein [Terriglobales bacterium]